MGVEDYLLTSTVNGILAQRLVRTLCPACREPYTALPEVVEEMRLKRFTSKPVITLYHPKGCEQCAGTGYLGRTTILEMLVMTDPIRRLVLKHADAGQIQQTALSEGMQSMYEDGLRKAVAGITTIEEVLRVTQENLRGYAVPMFRYKAVDLDGEVMEGEMEASSLPVVIERLQDSGHVPIRAEELKPGQSATRFRLPQLRRRRISQRSIGIFTEELATLLRAGLPLDRALEILQSLAEDEQMAAMVSRVQDAVRGGKALSDALEAQQKVFSRFYLNMIRAGEAGGALDVVLTRLSDYLERSKQLKDTVVSALIYPAILITVAGLSVVILLTFVVPQFTQMFQDMGKALPLPTQIVVGIGDAFRNYWWAILLSIAAIALLVQRHLGNPRTRFKWDGRLLRLPLFGELIGKLEVARFSRTLGTLLGNGVPLLTALSIVKETLSNRVLSASLDPVADRLKEGQGLAQPLMQAEMFPRLAVHMIRVGEETGQLEQMLLQVADIYDREVQTTIKRMLALMEPALILTLGLIIAAIIMSILVAILSVNELAF